VSPARELRILLVDDDPGDVLLIQEAFASCAGGRVRLRVASDGEQALAALRAAGGGLERPDIVLLDLNLPRKDGREVLAEAKSDPELRRVPILVLTTSDSEQDVLNAYSLHANAYLNKPLQMEQLRSTARLIVEFWGGLVRLPSR
jgi:CheY-like chemotaxis protein